MIPFDLVQETLLSDELLALREKELTLSEVVSETVELLDELSEEDKSKGFVNEAQDAFVAAEIKKAIKAQDAEPDILAVLIKADKLLTATRIFTTPYTTYPNAAMSKLNNAELKRHPQFSTF